MARSIKQDMLDYIPRYYHDSKIVDEKISAEASEFHLLSFNMDDLLNQFFVDRATWGLTDWERNLGLEQKSYTFGTWDLAETENVTTLEQFTWGELERGAADLSLEDRRANVKSRLRGFGTVTKALLKEVVQSFTNADMDVLEDPANYTVTIKFKSGGIPTNYDQAKKAVSEIIPAHLAVVYTSEFSTWDDVSASTWDNLANYTWDDVKGGLWSA